MQVHSGLMVFKCDAKMVCFGALPQPGSLPHFNNTASNLGQVFSTALPQTKKKKNASNAPSAGGLCHRNGPVLVCVKANVLFLLPACTVCCSNGGGFACETKGFGIAVTVERYVSPPGSKR